MGIFTKPSRVIEPDAPLSQAEHLNLTALALERDHAAGIELAAEMGRRATQRFAQIEAQRERRDAAHKGAQDALWAKICERQKYAVGH
jgi:hypothetical protein